MSYLKGLADKVNGLDNNFTKELYLKELIPNENNFYGIREIDELAESISENGLMHNLVVREKDDGSYEIISGERRYRALLKLGYDKVPCNIKKNISDLDAEVMLIQANVESRELTASEKMQGISRLKAIYEEKKSLGEKVPGKIRDLIGKDMGISGVQVGRYQKIDKDLIPELKEKLDKEEITLTQAHTLSSLNEEEQETIHEAIKDLDPKESKEETKILIEGIKQKVESNYDEETLNETYPSSEETGNNKCANKVKCTSFPKQLIQPLLERYENKELSMDQCIALCDLSKEVQCEINNDIEKYGVENFYIDKSGSYHFEHENIEVENDVEKSIVKEDENKEESKIEDSKNNKIDEINELLKQDPKPRIIINSSFIEGIFYTKELKILTQTMHGDKICATVGMGDTSNAKSTCNIDFDCFEKVTSIPLQGRSIEPQYGYKVNENTYLWFSFFKVVK